MLLSNTDPGKPTTLSSTRAFQNDFEHCREKQGEKIGNEESLQNSGLHRSGQPPKLLYSYQSHWQKRPPGGWPSSSGLIPSHVTVFFCMEYLISPPTTQTSWFIPSKIQRGRFPLCSWLRAYPGSGFWTYFLAKEERAHLSGEPSPTTLICMKSGALPLES